MFSSSKTDEIKMLEGRRRYITGPGGRKIYLSHVLSEVCGATLALVLACVYAGLKHSSANSDFMVTFGDDKSYEGALILKKVGQHVDLGGASTADDEEKRVVPEVGDAPPFHNMVPSMEKLAPHAKVEVSSADEPSEDLWQAVAKVPAFANMVPHVDNLKTNHEEPAPSGAESEEEEQQKTDEEEEGKEEDETKEEKEKEFEDVDEANEEGEVEEDEGTDVVVSEDVEEVGENDSDREHDGDEDKDNKDNDDEDNEDKEDNGDEDNDHKENENEDNGEEDNDHEDNGNEDKPEEEDEENNNEVSEAAKDDEETGEHEKHKGEEKHEHDSIRPDHFTNIKDEEKQPKHNMTKKIKGHASKLDTEVEELGHEDKELDEAFDKLMASDKRLDSLPKRYEMKSRHKIGKPFKAGIMAWSTLPETPKYAEPFGISINLDNLIFVTGSSKNHFLESQDAIGGLQKVWPHAITLYYDLGLDPHQAKEVKEWCNVIYRKFDFSLYPPHVSNLHTYAFKPLIIKEVLNRHPNILWLDAAFRANTDDVKAVYDQAKRYGGIVLQHDSAENITSSTDPGLFEYLPTARYKLRRITMESAGVIFIRNTPKIYWGVLYWWFLCALEKECIAPTDSKLDCKIDEEKEKRRPGEYRQCHRYDQSALNVLLANYYKFHREKYVAPHRDSKKILKSMSRRVTHDHQLKKC